MKSLVNSNKVAFSAGARLFVGPHGTAPAALPAIGLLGADAQFVAEQTVRQKQDRFPEVVVAESIQAQNARIEVVAREWTDDNLMLAFGLETADTETTAGGDTAVTDEVHTFNDDNLIVLTRPIKAGEAAVVTTTDGVTTYVAGTDYVLLPRDIQGRTLIFRLSTGTIPAAATVHVDYTYNLPATRTFPVGRRATVVYRTVKLEEELTNGGKQELIIWRARIGINGNIAINAVDTGADLPLIVQALYDPAQDELASLINYAEA